MDLISTEHEYAEKMMEMWENEQAVTNLVDFENDLKAKWVSAMNLKRTDSFVNMFLVLLVIIFAVWRCSGTIRLVFATKAAMILLSEAIEFGISYKNRSVNDPAGASMNHDDDAYNFLLALNFTSKIILDHPAPNSSMEYDTLPTPMGQGFMWMDMHWNNSTYGATEALKMLTELFSLVLMYEVYLCSCKLERRKRKRVQTLLQFMVSVGIVILVYALDSVITMVILRYAATDSPNVDVAHGLYYFRQPIEAIGRSLIASGTLYFFFRSLFSIVNSIMFRAKNGGASGSQGIAYLVLVVSFITIGQLIRLAFFVTSYIFTSFIGFSMIQWETRNSNEMVNMAEYDNTIKSIKKATLYSYTCEMFLSLAPLLYKQFKYNK